MKKAISFYVTMDNSHGLENGNGCHNKLRHPKASLSWLDLKVFYVRVSKCEIDASTPEYLTLNHIPLDRDTLLEVNGARTSMYSDGVSSLLRRDRLDKKFEEVTFVSTESRRVSGSVKFEVFDKDVLLLSGVLELCTSIGCVGELENNGQKWRVNCESDMVPGMGFLKGKPRIEVFVAGCFAGGSPIILTKTVQLSLRKKQMRNSLDSIPEYEAAESQNDVPAEFINLQVKTCLTNLTMFVVVFFFFVFSFFRVFK